MCETNNSQSPAFRWCDAKVEPIKVGVPILIAWKFSAIAEEESSQRVDTGIVFEGLFMSVVRDKQGPIEDIAFWVTMPPIPSCDDCNMPVDELFEVIGTSMNERSVCAECAKQYLPCGQCQDLVHKSGLIPITDDHGKGIDVCYDCYVWLEP